MYLFLCTRLIYAFITKQAIKQYMLKMYLSYKELVIV